MLPQEMLLNLKPDGIAKQQMTLTVHVLTALKQTIAKAWMTETVRISKVYLKLNLKYI